MATLKERVDEHDREIAAIRKLLLTGMKMLVRLEQSQKRLEAAQKETDRMLKELIRSLVLTRAYRLSSDIDPKAEEVDPENSLKAPRGSPPVRASIAAIPVETVGGDTRSRNSRVDESCSPSEDSI